MTAGPINRNVTQALKLLDHVEEVLRRFDVRTIVPLPTGTIRQFIAEGNWAGAVADAVAASSLFGEEIEEAVMGAIDSGRVPLPEGIDGDGTIITRESAIPMALAGLMGAVGGLLYFEIVRGRAVAAGYGEEL